MMNLHILYFIVTQPRQFVTIFFSRHRNKMFRFPSPCVLRWWVGRLGKRKKKENEHLMGSDSREGRPPLPPQPHPYKWGLSSCLAAHLLCVDQFETSISIDLFSLYILFSHFRPRDATRGNSFFQMSSYARANLRITNEKTKGKFP